MAEKWFLISISDLSAFAQGSKPQVFVAEPGLDCSVLGRCQRWNPQRSLQGRRTTWTASEKWRQINPQRLLFLPWRGFPCTLEAGFPLRKTRYDKSLRLLMYCLFYENEFILLRWDIFTFNFQRDVLCNCCFQRCERIVECVNLSPSAWPNGLANGEKGAGTSGDMGFLG